MVSESHLPSAVLRAPSCVLMPMTIKRESCLLSKPMVATKYCLLRRSSAVGPAFPGSMCGTLLGARANSLLDRTQGTGFVHNRVFGEGQGQETQDRHRKPPGVCRYYAPGLEGRVPNLLGTPLRSCA